MHSYMQYILVKWSDGWLRKTKLAILCFVDRLREENILSIYGIDVRLQLLVDII